MEDTKKNINILIFICWLAYTVAYIGRLNYNAGLVAIIEDLNPTKAEAGLVSSYFFFAYGIGQLVHGILSKKYNPKKMIFFALFASGILNILMPLAGKVEVMQILWLFNGIFQSIIWTSIIKALSEKLPEKDIMRAVVILSTSVAFGTFFAYGFTSFFNYFFSWRFVFYFASIILIIVSFIWLRILSRLKKVLPNILKIQGKETVSQAQKSFMVSSFLVLAVIAIANGFVKDGITTWVPSLLYETFGIEASLSILITLIIPLLSIIGSVLAKALHQRIKAHQLLNLIFFSLAAFLLLIIVLTFKYRNLLLFMVCFVGISCLMLAINNVITSMMPLELRNNFNPGLIAGLINAFCYLGSTLSAVILGGIADQKSWEMVFDVLLWATIFSVAIILMSRIFERRRVI